MKEPTINIVVKDNGPLEITCDAPWPAEKQALYHALFDAVRAHLPKLPQPGDVTRRAYEDASTDPDRKRFGGSSNELR